MRTHFILSLVLVYLESATAAWPFKQEKFTGETLIDAGSLGVNITGRVVALGDWDGDQKLDLVTLAEDRRSLQLYLWHKESFSYKPSHALTFESAVRNVVPGDFNHDGKLDLLVMYEQGERGGWWSGSTMHTGMTVYLGGGPSGGFREDDWALSSATEAQPIIFDADGSLRPSLLGFTPAESGSADTPRIWQNDGKGFSLRDIPLSPADQICQLANFHSSAFIDIDGDCLPDLVLHCERPRTTSKYIQIWLNKGKEGYQLTKSYDLPKGSGALSFADMNRDGTMDIVFPVCGRHSSSSGAGSDCSLNIAYNRQVPVCTGVGSEYNNNGAVTSEVLLCRGWGSLCVADPSFEFAFDSSNDDFLSIPFAALFHGAPSEPDLLMHLAGDPTIALPIRPGDFNVDGYPDLLFVISNDTAVHSGMFAGSRGTQARIVQSVPCKKGVPGCTGKQKRGYEVKSGKGWEVLDHLVDVTGASWVDIDDDGSLDILLQRSGHQGQGGVTFIQNNFYHDAFFLKAQVLNGACEGDCQATSGGKKYKPLGVSYSGATYKFTVLDTLGRRVAQQSAQLPQTGYHALETPYSFIGLGRTNNYVERLTVGASLYPPWHLTNVESIVPNSQILVNPPFPQSLPDNGETAPESGSPVKARSTEWHTELFLHPGDWIPWVGAAVFGTVLALVFVVVALNEKEKKEDEKDRRRALHAINFQAL